MTDDLVLVAEFFNPTDAHLLRAELEAHGIEVRILDNHAAGLLQAAAGARVMVYQDTLEAALEILNEGTVGVDLDSENVYADQDIFGDGEDESQSVDEASAAAEDTGKDEEQPRADETLNRAFNAAVMGLLFFPLQFYSVFLMIKLLSMKDEIVTAKRWKMFVTPVLNLFQLGFIVGFLNFYLSQ